MSSVRGLLLVVLVSTDCTSCGACTPVSDPWTYNYANADNDVSVNVEGDGVTTGWRLSMVGMPNTSDPTFLVYIQRDDCPPELEMHRGQIFIQGHEPPEGGGVDIVDFSYETFDECTAEYCTDCAFVPTEVEISGDWNVSANGERLRVSFENYRIEIYDEPASGEVVLHTITLDGVYIAYDV